MIQVATMAVLLVGLVVPLAAGQTPTVEVPAEIKAPTGHKLLVKMEAKGVQVYHAVEGKSGALAWALEGPLAELSDSKGSKLAIHYHGPSWEAVDGSRVVKDDEKNVKQSPAPNAAADLPWLLVPVKSDDPKTQKAGTISNVVYVQRVSTSGGKAPAELPKRKGSKIGVPYTAVYYFWVKAD